MQSFRKKSSFVAAVVAVAILGLLVVAPNATSAPAAATGTHATKFTSIPVAGTTPAGQSFHGTMNITRFAAPGGTLSAVGTITGVVKNSSGVVTRSVINAPASLPVEMGAGSSSAGGADAAAQTTSTCNVLHLVLGPLDLNLLGLHVHLNRVVLDITAQRGSGQLLGNLLCAIAHLLDGTGLSGVLAQLLTAVTRVLSLTSALG